MERRKAITAAAAASLTLLAGAAGIALNSGIVGAGTNDNVGQLSPVSDTNSPITNSTDDPATTAVTPAPAVQPTTSRPVTASSASSYQHDDEYENDEQENDARVQFQSDDYERYEGAEDDD